MPNCLSLEPEGRRKLLLDGLKTSTKEVLDKIQITKSVLLNPAYDLHKIIDNELDFFLGAVFAQIIDRYTIFCLNKKIKLTPGERSKINRTLFSKADEIKKVIGKRLGQNP